MTTASRSLAPALWAARFACGLLTELQPPDWDLEVRGSPFIPVAVGMISPPISLPVTRGPSLAHPTSAIDVERLRNDVV
jgi:hypothetical protein